MAMAASECGRREGAMSIETIDAIYHHVAGQLAESANEAWSEIRLQISIIDGSVGLTGDYDRAQGGTADLDVRRLDYSVSKALRNLHRLTVQEGQEPWSEVVFTLKAGGNFALRFLR
jgi:hypothetical protein